MHACERAEGGERGVVVACKRAIIGGEHRVTGRNPLKAHKNACTHKFLDFTTRHH